MKAQKTSNKPTIKLIFTVFKSNENTKMGLIFQNGFHQVLDIYNLKKDFKTAKEYWLTADNVYAILVHSEDKKTYYGGARLELKEKGIVLPLEKFLGRQEPKVFEIMEDFQAQGVAEVCALWKNRLVENNPLDISVLIMATISLMKQLNLSTVVSISSGYIEEAVKRIGVSRYTAIGNKGVFPFPQGNVALLDYYPYPSSLKLGAKRENEIINKLFENPEHTYQEPYKNEIIQYSFNLRI